jgi:hypothetical protein
MHTRLPFKSSIPKLEIAVPALAFQLWPLVIALEAQARTI